LEENVRVCKKAGGKRPGEMSVFHFLWVVRCVHASILHCYGVMAPKDNKVTTLTFWDHVTSSVEDFGDTP